MSHPPGRRQAAGFTLIELIVVMSILAILLGIAIPNVQSFLVNYRASAQANDLIADMAFARGEAAKLGRTVQVIADGGGWAAGWIVGADLDSSGAVSGSAEIFRQHGAAEDDFTFGSTATTLAFGPAGQLIPSTTVEIAVCEPAGFKRHRAVVVNGVGRAQICVANQSTGSLSACSSLSC